jgi:HEAT repeat protein
MKLAGDDRATNEDRVLALELLLEEAPPDTYGDLVAPAKQLTTVKQVPVQAAALPVYARVAPEQAAGDLALMLENQSLAVDLRVAMALAWGEVARSKNKAAQGALEQLIKDSNPRVRAAAAEAYGNVGRMAQDALFKMVKNERYDVSLGAARGLWHSADAGASVSNAVGGIYQLWKRKGKPRRDAAGVYAKMARSKPGAVENYLAGAAVSNDDAALHPIAVEGLCNAMVAGNKDAPGDLSRAIKGGSVEVRRMIIECVSDNPKLLPVAGRIAISMADDNDSQIRAEAARVLAQMASGEKTSADVGERLARLAKDDNREVRLIAIRALSAMGSAAPKAALEALPRAFENGDETERLTILRAAKEMKAGELAQMAAADPSPLVRVAAIDTAIATRTGVGATLNSALSDPEPTVRTAALARLAAGNHGLSAEEVDRALGLAIRDPSESISTLALTTMAKIGDPPQVVARLQRLFDSPSERERTRAATAAAGLAERDAKQAIKLLERLYSDPSRDVRAAMLRSLATAYATTLKPDELAKMLRNSESNPTRRLVATAAFIVQAHNPGSKEPAIAALKKVVEDGPPLAKLIGRLGLGLIDASADGFAFLTTLVP